MTIAAASMFGNGLRYAFQKLFDLPSRWFIEEGRGILARAERCERYWQAHRELSAAWVRDNVADGAELVVIGAGFLLDLDRSWLATRKGANLFVDANPEGRRAIRELGRTVAETTFRCCDVTDRLDAWRRALRRADSIDAAIAELWNTGRTVPELTKRFEARAVVSLNVMSQLILPFREQVARWLLDRQVIDAPDEVLPASVEHRLLELAAQLQREHVQFLTSLDPERIIILADDEWYTYQPTQSVWDNDRALHVPLDLAPRYREARTDSWLWHVAPFGIEDANHGAIHRVQARVFTRRAGDSVGFGR